MKYVVYRKQLEIYAYLIEKRYGKKVSKMTLYYTNEKNKDPLITFEYKKDAIDSTIGAVCSIVKRIEDKDFEHSVQNSYSCKYCDMRYYCGKENV